MKAEAVTEIRELRPCDACPVVDDHPRCQVGAVVGSGGAPAQFHMDCHARLGCRTCLHMMAASDNAKGADLLAFLVAKPPTSPDNPLSIEEAV